MMMIAFGVFLVVVVVVVGLQYALGIAARRVFVQMPFICFDSKFNPTIEFDDLNYYLLAD